MNCQWQVGMLVVRSCGLPAAGSCSYCGQELCGLHTVMGPGGLACPGCAASQHGYETTEDAKLARERDRYYGEYGGAAQFGEDGYFTDAEGAALSPQTYVPPPSSKKNYDPKDS